MLGQGRLASASRRLPDFDRTVSAATGNLLAIWTETNTKDKPVKSSIASTHYMFENKQVVGHVPGVPAQRKLALARLRVPDLDSLVPAATC